VLSGRSPKRVANATIVLDRRDAYVVATIAKSMDVIHTAIRISSLDATRAFYEDGLGLQQTDDFEFEGTRNYYVGTAEGAEIQFKIDPTDEQPITPDGIDHIALGVDDVNEAFTELVASTDCPVVRAPTTVEQAGSRVAFVEDPDGYVVELVEHLDSPG
jgi:lactoylglutathione lyase